jgi:hypothetical protein
MKRGLPIGEVAERGYQGNFVKVHPWDQKPDDEVNMAPIIPFYDPQLGKVIIPNGK